MNGPRSWAPRELRAAAGFLTCTGSSPPAPSSATLVWFPPVGAAIGWAVGKIWQRADVRSGPLSAAAIVVAADCLLTGGLHLDGLADSADGLLSHGPGGPRLKIMAEPQVGAFGVTALVLSVVCRTAALASLPPSPAMLAAIYCSSRTAMAAATRALPYARPSGLATAFLPSGEGEAQVAAACAAGAAGALLLASKACGRRGLWSIVAGWLASAAVLELARRKVGGFTGDVLGAAGAAGETVCLLALSGGAGKGNTRSK